MTVETKMDDQIIDQKSKEIKNVQLTPEEKAVPGESYIKLAGLGNRVWDMKINQKMKPALIAQELVSEGHKKVTARHVSRYIRTRRDYAKDGIRSTMTEHLNRNLPKDLQALELLEGVTLNWALETKKKFITKVFREKQEVFLDEFEDNIRPKLMLSKFGSKEAMDCAKACLKLAADIVMDELDHRKFRLQAGKRTLEVVQTKLKFASDLAGSGSGNIYIGNAEEVNVDQTTEENKSMDITFEMESDGSYS